ncbi:hypothetical protein CMZ84_11985 [Lysobacteraceae bacterium NML93-0399]|nr:hypothetical protein CMZ84_11985 [Xanthomonadaceae bacterium NML93-0399]
MAAIPDLVLRDIHQPPAPPWWPPAAGWWWCLGIALACCAALGLWLAWRAWRRRHWQRVFEREMESSASPAERIAAMSALLRRAARRRRADADRLRGEDWLQFLDEGADRGAFTEGVGRALHDGAFRRDPGAVDLRALQALARTRFVALMTARR